MKQFLGILLCVVMSNAAPGTPSVAEAKKFLEEADARLLALTNEAGRAAWVQSNFITDDTEALSALVVSRVATANGIHPDSTIGLNFFGSRLHCPYNSLTPEAQAIIGRRSGSVPRTAPMVDLLSPAQLDSLTSLVHNRAA